MVDPSAREVMEGVSTSFTPAAAVFQFIEFSITAPWAESVSIFEAFFRHVTPGPALARDQLVISLHLHLTPTV